MSFTNNRSYCSLFILNTLSQWESPLLHEKQFFKMFKTYRETIIVFLGEWVVSIGLLIVTCDNPRIHLVLFCLCSLNIKDILFLPLFLNSRDVVSSSSNSCCTVPFYTICSWNNMCIFYQLELVCSILSILLVCILCMY